MKRSPRSSPPCPLQLRRRTFLRTAAFGVTALILPASGISRGAASPNTKLNLAFIGVGGRGRDDLEGLCTQNVVALCDVDTHRGADSFRRFPKAKVFQDYRVMLDRVAGEIDGVVVATPDHTHAGAVLRALDLGKHVYCEKPLAHSLQDVRRITRLAREKKVATQLGNQGHSTDSIRQFCEMIQSGAIGRVREVHAWCANSYRPRDYRVRPAETPPVPPTLQWDLWLGPAPLRPYHPTYLPGKWRGWVDFGTGIIGDWCCHVLDPVFWALELNAPTSVVAHAPDYDNPQVRAETFPGSSVIEYEFPARGDQPPVLVKWFSGGLPPRPPELEPNRNLVNIGAIVIGEKGKIMYGSHGAAGAQLIPASAFRDYQRPPQTIPRSHGHYEDWVNACQGGVPASSNFDYGGPLTEVALLGVLALRLNGQKLAWDSGSLAITNHPEANRLVAPPARAGWTA